MSQFLSQQLNSLWEGWTTSQTNQTSSKTKQFRAKILDLYDEIFMKHKQITTLECNFLHLRVNRKGLYHSIRNAMNAQQYDENNKVLMFNKTFEFCINSLLDEKLLVVEHAFQTLSIMLISIAKCNRYLSVSDIVTYICDFDQFDKYFEIIDERISNTMMKLNNTNCIIAALEFTLSIMTISSNIHSNLFTEQLLINQFHKVLFKYLKQEIKQIKQQYIDNNNNNNNDDNDNENELVITHNNNEQKQQNDDQNINESKEENKEDHDNKKEEEYILKSLKDKQQILMLVLSNITTLSHYQRFESDNIALKYISSIKVQPTSHINYIIVSLAQHTIQEYRSHFPETRLHQLGNYVQSISGFFSSTIMRHNDDKNKSVDTDGGIFGNIISNISTNTSTTSQSTASSTPTTEDMNKRMEHNTNIMDNLLSNLTYCSSMLLLSIYTLITFNNPGWMVHSAGLRKSTPDEITKHPRVVVSPHECPLILRYLISLSSCIFQYYFYEKQVFEDNINNKQSQHNTFDNEKLIESHEQLTRLSLIIYSRLTEIPACLIVLYSNDFKCDPFLEWAHKDGNSIIWKQISQQPVIAILFDIWCDYIQNIGKSITQYHEQHMLLINNNNNNNNDNKEEDKEKEEENDIKLKEGMNSYQLFNPLSSSHTLFSLRILLDIFLRCLIFQNQMELFFGKSLFYLRLMKILMNMMKLFITYNENNYNELLFDIITRIVVTIRMMIGCCENIFDHKENYMISFFLELAKYTETFRIFNNMLHCDDNRNKRENNHFSDRLKKDSRVVVRVSKFFEDAITLEFPEWKTSNIQTPLHHSRALKLVRETLKCDEFEIPPPKLNGQYLGYQENNKKEIKFFNDIIKKNIVKIFTKKCIS